MGVTERLKGVKDQFCELVKQKPEMSGIDIDSLVDVRVPKRISYDRDNRTFDESWIPYHHHRTALTINVTDEQSAKVQTALSQYILSRQGYRALRRAFNPGLEAASRWTSTKLLELGAVKITDKPPYFEYAKGDYGPYYVDCSVLTTDNPVADGIAAAMADMLKLEVYTEIGCILGGEVRGIVPGKLLAREANLPFFVVRKEAKKRGMKDLIVGDPKALQPPALLVEDLARDAGSKLLFIDNSRSCNIDCNVTFVAYDRLEGARERVLKERNAEFYSLTDHDITMRVAIEEGFSTPQQVAGVEEHLKETAKWLEMHPWPDRPKAKA
jgi:orotate phosphoribosyltransferase